MRLNDPRSVAGGFSIINRKSTPYSDIALPQFVTDPLYTSSQGQLDKLGSGLISGEGIPDYYKGIGDFNSPQFQAMLNSVKGQVMQGSQEASAIQGTGRSGVATTASNNALNQVLPQLTYQDYLRAMQGRGALLDTGINVESGVRGSAQQQGMNETNFNQTLFNDKMGLASAMDSYKKSAAGAEGGMFGTIGGGILGGIAGSFAGMPLQGAALGAGLGSSAFGGGSGSGNISSFLDMIGKIPGVTTTNSGVNTELQDSSLGSFKSLSSLNSSNPAVSNILNGGF